MELSAINEVNRTITSNNGTDKISIDKDDSQNEEEEDEFGLADLFADTSEVTKNSINDDSDDEEAAPPANSETEAKDQATADKQ